MAGEEPPYLTVGTDVSAKYKGAFCEAKIKKVTRSVKCKLTFKNNVGVAIVTDDQVRGTLRVGAHVEAKHPEKNQYLEAVINKLNDYSQYTVVFDDGDETTLRRTSLCLKSGRHFAESETLDQLPLTHPEHFGNPVMNSKGRRSRTTTRSPAVDESSDDEQSSKSKETKTKPSDPDIGKVLVVEMVDKKKTKENWFPALIVSPKCQDSLRIKKQEEYLVRSFRDGRYHVVNKKDSKEFSRDQILKPENNSLKNAVDKVLAYLDKDDLPNHWDRDVLFGLEDSSNEESDQATESDTSDDEPSEEKDRFVAQLYKFMDDRGTSINKAPSVCNRDLNLYKLFKVVQKVGGYNRATNQMQWKNVYAKMGFPPGNSSSSHLIKQAYKKYLHSFEEFYRKLGISMGSSTRSGRVRYRSGRYLLLSRDQHFKGSNRRSKHDSKSSSNEKDSEKNKSRGDSENKSVDLEETSNDKQDKDKDSAPVNIDVKKTEDKKDKDKDEGSDDSKTNRDESDHESSPTSKDDAKSSKGKSKLVNAKDDESLPKRRGRKKIQKVQPADDDESSNINDDEEEDFRDSLSISIGDRVKVKYGRGRQQKIYEAKVLKIGEDENDKEFFVHYTGWNMRYDEWVKRHRIVKNLSQKGWGRRPRSATPAKNVKPKKGRPQSQGTPAKKDTPSDRKTNSAVSRSRGNRSDKSNNDTPIADQKRTTRHSSLQRDISDESDSDQKSETTESQSRPKRTMSKKNSIVEDNDTSTETKADDDSEDTSTVVKETEDSRKKSVLKSEKENVTKDASGEKTQKDKAEAQMIEEDDVVVKKPTKKSLKERQKSDDSTETGEDVAKVTRRPRGRPPRQSGEEKKSSNERKISVSETDSKEDLEVADNETPTPPQTSNSEQELSSTSVIKDEDSSDENDKTEAVLDSNTSTEEDRIEDESKEPEEPTAAAEEEEGEESTEDSLNINEEPTRSVQSPKKEVEDESTKLESVSFKETVEKKKLPSEEDINCEQAKDVSVEDSDVNLSSTTDSDNLLKVEDIQQEPLDVQNDNEGVSESENELDAPSEVKSAVVEASSPSDMETSTLNVTENNDTLKFEDPVREKTVKNELIVSNDPIHSVTANISISDANSVIKSKEMDVYEYSEEVFEEKINFKESSLKKLEKTTPNSDTQISEAVEEDVISDKENETFVETESVKCVVAQQKVSTSDSTSAFISNDEKVEVKSEKYDVVKVEQWPFSSSVHSSSSSSKGTKKDKKKKNHKSEKRKLLLEVDSSEEGSGNEEPKTKKKKSKDEDGSSRKESKGKDQRQKKSRDKRNKLKADRDELKLLKKKASLEKSRRKECKKKKENQEKSRSRDKDEENKHVDSDEMSSVSSDSCQRKEKKKSKKHQHRCDKSRDDSEKKRVKKGKHDDEATSDESNRSSKKTKREEKSKSKKKRDKLKAKELPVSSEDSNSSKLNPAFEKLKEKVGEKTHKEELESEMPKYLMCEEKVPASPMGMIDLHETSSSAPEDKSDKTVTTKDGKESCSKNKTAATVDVSESSFSGVPISVHNRHLKLEVAEPSPTTIIDNTPPTTPESNSSTLVSEPLHYEHGSSSCMSPNDTDSNQLVSTGKSSQSSSPNDYSDEAERCREMMIDDADHRVEMATNRLEEVEGDDVKSGTVFRSGTSLKRSTLEHEEQSQSKKRKKRHRKRSSSVSDPLKHGAETGSSSKQSSKHSRVETDDIPTSSETSNSTSGLLLSRLIPPAGFTNTSALPQPTRPSRFNFYVELDDYTSGDERIKIIQQRLQELRRTYMALKAEVACIDRRRKKLKKKEKDAASSSNVTSAVVECN